MLRLNLASGVGPITFARLMEMFGEPQRVFEASVGRLMDVERVGESTARNILAVGEHQVDAELELAAKHGVWLLALGDEGYPPCLTRIFDPRSEERRGG